MPTYHDHITPTSRLQPHPHINIMAIFCPHNVQFTRGYFCVPQFQITASTLKRALLPCTSLVPRLLHRKTGREPGRFYHVPRDVVCVVLCVVLIIELLPTQSDSKYCPALYRCGWSSVPVDVAGDLQIDCFTVYELVCRLQYVYSFYVLTLT